MDDCVEFKKMDMARLTAEEEGGIVITNPPYGERIGEKKQIEAIYSAYNEFYEKIPHGRCLWLQQIKRSKTKFSAGLRTEDASCTTADWKCATISSTVRSRAGNKRNKSKGEKLWQ